MRARNGEYIPDEIVDIMRWDAEENLSYAQQEIKMRLKDKELAPDIKSRLQKVNAKIEKLRKLEQAIYRYEYV